MRIEYKLQEWNGGKVWVEEAYPNILFASQRRVAILCKEGRVPGAELVGNRWFLPSDAVKPQDPRKAKKD